jgi:hypothetical protein
MKRMLTLVMALGVTALFSSAVLAGADCAYHKTQAAVDQTDATKSVAAAPAPAKTDASQVQTAQAERPVKAASETKK